MNQRQKIKKAVKMARSSHSTLFSDSHYVPDKLTRKVEKAILGQVLSGEREIKMTGDIFITGEKYHHRSCRDCGNEYEGQYSLAQMGQTSDTQPIFTT